MPIGRAGSFDLKIFINIRMNQGLKLKNSSAKMPLAINNIKTNFHEDKFLLLLQHRLISSIMITKLFNAIGNGFETFFKILPSMGPIVNTLIISIGVIAIIGWIWYMIKTGKSSKA